MHEEVRIEERNDGFREISIYRNGCLVKVITKYPNGITEVEHFKEKKEE